MHTALRLGAVAAASLALTSCGGDEPVRPEAFPSAGGPTAQAGRGAVTDGRIGGAFTARPGDERVLDRGGRRPAPGVTKPRTGRGGVGAEASCAEGDLQPAGGNLDRVSASVLCFMNAMRANDGLPALRENQQLEDASVKHSQDMVNRKFFAHDTPDGVDVVARLRAIGYVPRAGDWVVGENLAWGSGALATPRAIVQAWMDSPAHRENLLSPDYREVGLGIVLGVPARDADGGATFTTDFGTKLSGGEGSAGAGGDSDGGNVLGDDASSSSSASTAAVRRANAAARRKCRRKRGRARTRCVRAARRAALRRR